MEKEIWEEPGLELKNKISTKKVLLILLSALIGALFIFSAVSKVFPIQYFEYIISSQLQVSQRYAALASRFVIGLEGALGLLLLINIFGYRRWVLKACLTLLLVFCIHLVYLLIAQGNDVNCGCMGSVAPMSPALSLLKNAGLIAGLLVLLKWHKPDDGMVLNVATFPMALIIIAVPFFIFPVEQQIKMPLSKLYHTTRSEHPVLELRKGKHILCFMSLSCEHCRHAAGIIAGMKKNNPALPFYFALSAGADSTRAERFADFLKETKANDIPYHFLEKEDFINMIKSSGSDGVPVILWMQDTTVIRKVNGGELDQKEIETWIAQ